MSGTLFLVATPIGNEDDITLRALEVLRTADLIVYEERRAGERFLRRHGIAGPTESLNEHNEKEAAAALVDRLAAGQSIALISDGGTPVFCDPGAQLVRAAAARGVRIVPVPGASSLLPALTVSGFPIDRFLFYGWLSPKRERRIAELRRLVREPHTIVLMETPYRMLALLRDLAETFGDSRRVCLTCNLTMPDEEIFRGTAAELHQRLGGGTTKGEFVVVIEGRPVRAPGSP